MLIIPKRLAVRMLGYRRAKALRDRVWSRIGPMSSHMVGPQQGEPKAIDNLEELDLELARAERAFAVSDDNGRKALEEFCYTFPEALPADPYSQAYYATQMRRYCTLAGRDSYSAASCEYTELNVEQALRRPFPYSTQSATTVGDQLMAQGLLIRAMGLPPGARIVEFGAGWGNLTMHLARMGYHVTAVEIAEPFVDLIRRRAARDEKEVEVVRQDMLEFEAPQPYDGACFFESFHHCSDHLQMLANLHKMITPEGVVVFGGETIFDLPYPWGVRLDGFAAWSARRYGWLELGFDTSYFLRTLLFLGWAPTRYGAGFSLLVNAITARKANLVYRPGEISLPLDEDGTWAAKEAGSGSSWRFTTGKSVMSCARDVDPKQVEFCLSNYTSSDLGVELVAGSVRKAFQVAKGKVMQICTVPVRDWNGQIAIHSETRRRPLAAGPAGAQAVGIAVNSFRLVC